MKTFAFKMDGIKMSRERTPLRVMFSVVRRAFSRLNLRLTFNLTLYSELAKVVYSVSF